MPSIPTPTSATLGTCHMSRTAHTGGCSTSITKPASRCRWTTRSSTGHAGRCSGPRGRPSTIASDNSSTAKRTDITMGGLTERSRRQRVSARSGRPQHANGITKWMQMQMQLHSNWIHTLQLLLQLHLRKLKLPQYHRTQGGPTQNPQKSPDLLSFMRLFRFTNPGRLRQRHTLERYHAPISGRCSTVREGTPMRAKARTKTSQNIHRHG